MLSKFLDKGNEMVKTRKELRDYITYERNIVYQNFQPLQNICFLLRLP